METKFYKKNPVKISYNGCFFHSLSELKYALAIEDEFAFLREGIEIYYDPHLQESTLYIREHTRKYRPDFLIRNWSDSKAYIIEIKPSGFDNYEQLAMRQKVSEHFIKTYNYDWEYKVVYTDEIILSEKQQLKFDALRNKINACTAKLRMQALDEKYNRQGHQQYFHSVPNFKNCKLPNEQYRLFVRRGVVRPGK
jgi:hypothetical protein